MLAKFFRSVEARTAVLPLLNDELVSFNKNLENQANAQDVAAKAAFTASNTIQGQLTRLGSAFTNLTAEGSEFGILIRESLKIAAVTVEALGSAFKLLLLPARAIFAAVGEVGKAIAEAMGVDATNTLFELEQGWIMVKEGVTQFSSAVIGVGKTVGTVVGRIIKAVIGAFKTINDFINGNHVLKFIFGITKLPKLSINVDTNLDAVNQLKEGVEGTATATNNIVKSNLKNNKAIKDGTEATKKQREEADKLKEAYKKVGDSIATNIRDSLVEAVKGTKTLGEMAKNILNDIADSFLRIGITTALKSTGLDIFSNLSFANGGRPPVGKASLVGERGPEMFVPKVAGTIIPNNQISGGGSTNIVVNVDATNTEVEGDGGQAEELGTMLAAAVQAEIVNQQRPGGLLA